MRIKIPAIRIITTNLESAKEKLQSTDQTVSEIAYVVCFDDPGLDVPSRKNLTLRPVP